ncbi:MAG: hypothetical protein M0P72_01580 [Metallibacterium scheffleri]|uniref:hypothetical protein n=1 Tax=Metallibacterium scheffleri TaxID=993689 RepID=UPI0026F1D48C|nr:hypothetical protein [Metallibacterium scheffleri]MCK9365827.1 hypothetical protein [Metallibacterium scheffleri]
MSTRLASASAAHLAIGLFTGVVISSWAGFFLGIGMIGWLPWWHGPLFLAGMLLLLGMAWYWRRRLLPQAVLLLMTVAYPVAAASVRSPQVLVFGLGMLLPLLLVLIVVVVSVKLGKPAKPPR